jgi:hypothetical protein
MIDFSVTVDPHDFVPLHWWDSLPLHPQWGRCKHCLIGRMHHPLPIWAPARAVNDRRTYTALQIQLAFEMQCPRSQTE